MLTPIDCVCVALAGRNNSHDARLAANAAKGDEALPRAEMLAKFAAEANCGECSLISISAHHCISSSEFSSQIVHRVQTPTATIMSGDLNHTFLPNATRIHTQVVRALTVFESATGTHAARLMANVMKGDQALPVAAMLAKFAAE